MKKSQALAVKRRSMAIGYARVSTTRQAKHAISLDEQKAKMGHWCEANDRDLKQVFVDRGRTGRLEDRQEFQQMIAYACDRQNNVDTVVVYSISRFFRNLRHYLNYKATLQEAGVNLVSATQDFPDGPTGTLMGSIIAAFDEHASEVNAETVRDVMAANAENGFWNGAAAPFGFKTVIDSVYGKKEKKKLEPDLCESEVVVLIFDLYLGRHKTQPALGIKAIAKYLNEREIKHRGAVFHTSTIEKILKRTAYKGEHWYNKTNSRTKELRPEDEWIKIPVQPIIAPETFDAVQRKLQASRPRETAPRVVNGPTLLVGLAKCELCGGAMMLRTGKGGRYRYLTCANQATRGKVLCQGQSIRMDFVDEAVLSEIEAQVLKPDRLALLLREIFDRTQSGRAGIEDELKREKMREAAAASQLKNLYDMVARGITDLDDPILKDKIDVLKLQKSEAENAAASLKLRLAAQPVVLDAIKVKEFSTGVQKRLRDADPAFRREWLRLFVDAVIIGPEVIRIFGPKKPLLAGVAAGDATAVSPVPSFAREWRARRDSNS